MTIAISANHRKRFEEIRIKLHVLGCRESEFLKIELLFFEVIAISKSYGENIAENNLLAALKNIQHDQYQKTQLATHKPAERELFIRRFTVSLRKLLSNSNKLVFGN